MADAAVGADILRVCSLNMLVCATYYECGDQGTPTAAELKATVERLSAYIGSVLKLRDVLATEEVEPPPGPAATGHAIGR